MKDVAAAAGVSLGTVSNVLNRPERVSAASRERVERAMLELGGRIDLEHLIDLGRASHRGGQRPGPPAPAGVLFTPELVARASTRRGTP